VQATDADLRRNLWGGTLSAAGGGSVPPMTIGNPSGDGRTFVVSFGGAGPKDGVYDLPCRRSRTSPSR